MGLKQWDIVSIKLLNFAGLNLLDSASRNLLNVVAINLDDYVGLILLDFCGLNIFNSAGMKYNILLDYVGLDLLYFVLFWSETVGCCLYAPFAILAGRRKTKTTVTRYYLLSFQ